MEQYNGDLEAYIQDLGDASKITATISHNFSAMQLLGLQQIVYYKDLRLLELSKKHWGDAQAYTQPVAVSKASFNLNTAKIAGPIEL